jgi:autotransporter-associated beta strand protein
MVRFRLVVRFGNRRLFVRQGRFFPGATAFVLAAIVLTATADASTYSWIGTSGSDWNTAANWSPSTVPNSPGAYVINGETTGVTTNLDIGATVGILCDTSPSVFSYVWTINSTGNSLAMNNTGGGNNPWGNPGAAIATTSIGHVTVKANIVMTGDLYAGTAGTSQGDVYIDESITSLSTSAQTLYLRTSNNGSSCGIFESDGSIGASGGIINILEDIDTGGTKGLVTLAGPLGPSVGSVTMSASGGLMILSGSNSYTGPTNIIAGSLQIGDSSGGESLASLSIGDSGTLVFSHTDSLNFAGAISGPGALVKLDSGMLTLSGSNSYSGKTIISAGTLAIGGAGSLSGNTAVSVSAGAAFATAINAATSGGAVNAGGSLNLAASSMLNLQDGYYKTLAVAGSGTLGSAAKLLFDIGPSGAAGPNDALSFSGTVTMGGPLAFSFADPGGAPLQGKYALVTAASGLAGAAFSSGTGTIAGENWSLSDDAGHIYLTIGASSRNCRWTGGNGTSWDGNNGANWTDAGVQAAPGVVGCCDTATFDGSGGSNTTITLDGASPTLAALVFNTPAGGYSLQAGSGGTLEMTNGALGGTITVASGTHSTAAPINLVGGNLQISASNGGILTIAGNIADDRATSGIGRSLSLGGDGTGELVLSGTNTYAGGTTVARGTLVANNSRALADGSSLSVGTDLRAFGGVTPALAGPLAGPGAAPVPEPPAPALLLAALATGPAAWRGKRLLLRLTRRPRL